MRRVRYAKCPSYCVGLHFLDNLFELLPRRDLDGGRDTQEPHPSRAHPNTIILILELPHKFASLWVFLSCLRLHRLRGLQSFKYSPWRFADTYLDLFDVRQTPEGYLFFLQIYGAEVALVFCNAPRDRLRRVPQFWLDAEFRVPPSKQVLQPMTTPFKAAQFRQKSTVCR